VATFWWLTSSQKDCFAVLLKNLNLQIFSDSSCRHPDSTSVGYVLWIPACAGMTVFFNDW
jgi:hypothetical protein